jgi:hypothetical protein
MVTAPPVLIATAGIPARVDAGGSNFEGPFVVGTSLYLVLISQSAFPNTDLLNVYKSTDNGATWTSMDQSHRPTTNNDCDVVQNAGVFTIIYGSSAAGNALKVIAFNTATDTFGAVSVDGPLTNGNARVAQFASGDLCVWYNQLTLGLCAVVIFSAGAWGAAVTVPNAKNSIATIVMGLNNVAQLFYDDSNAPGINVFFRTFTNGGALGGEQAVFSASFFNTPAGGIPIGRTVIWNGNFIVPYYAGVNGNQAGVYIGTPYTAPVWTFTLVDPVLQPPQVPPGLDQVGDLWVFAMVDSNNNLILFWITVNDNLPAPPLPGSVNFMSYAINPGTGFGAPVVFYNETTNPQRADPTHINDILHTLSANRFASGRFGVVTAMDITNPGGGTPPGPTVCAGFYLLDGSGCPKNAQGV